MATIPIRPYDRIDDTDRKSVARFVVQFKSRRSGRVVYLDADRLPTEEASKAGRFALDDATALAVWPGSSPENWIGSWSDTVPETTNEPPVYDPTNGVPQIGAEYIVHGVRCRCVRSRVGWRGRWVSAIDSCGRASHVGDPMCVAFTVGHDRAYFVPVEEVDAYLAGKDMP